MKYLAWLFKVFIWWFTSGASHVLSWVRQQVHILFYGLSIRVLYKNLFSPLYGMNKFYEHIVGIVVRGGHLLILGSFAYLGAGLFYVLFIIYIFLPLSILLFLNQISIAITIYIFLLLIYLLFKNSTKASLKKQLKNQKTTNFLNYANLAVYKIYQQNKNDVNQFALAILNNHLGQEFFMRLENPSVNFSQFKFHHHWDTLFKQSFKIAWKKNKTEWTSIDVIQAIWQLRSKTDIFWDSFILKNNEIEAVFDFFDQKHHLHLYQKNWSSYAIFQNKYGFDKGLSSPFSKKVNEFCHDFAKSQQASEMIPLVGRDKEYQQVLQILKHQGGAVLLIGQSGIGKSRIIEYLAENIAIDQVPEYLQDMRLVELNIGRILSGDALNSAQEGGKNLISVLDEITRARHIILNIDNLAFLAGENASHLFNLGILSKYIEQGKIRIIATSTTADYNSFLSQNPTYIRLFTKIWLEPLSNNFIQQILEYKAINLEKKYQTIIGQKCFYTILEISAKHFTNIANPAQSLSLLQESVFANLNQNYISSEEIKETLAKNTGIKITAIKEDERNILNNLEEIIHQNIVGQNYAVSKIADALRRARLDLHDYESPIAKFMFVGPTGVGKTELAKTIAHIHFGSEQKMLRLDMSEFQDVSAIKRLIGDNKNTGLLTEPVKNTAHMLILFDELEKAHSDILNLFLQLLDDGRITDGKNHLIDFRNTIIIATSNAGAEIIWQRLKDKILFTDIAKELKDLILIKFFRPEFLNRFSDIIVFEPLNKEMITDIAQKLLLKSQQLFKQKEIFLNFTEESAKIIADQAFNYEMGARPLKHFITEKIESKIAKGLLSGEFKKREHLWFNGRDIVVKK